MNAGSLRRIVISSRKTNLQNGNNCDSKRNLFRYRGSCSIPFDSVRLLMHAVVLRTPLAIAVVKSRSLLQ